MRNENMTTNKEIMQAHDNHTCNPKAKKGESQLYDQDCVEVMLDAARADAITILLNAINLLEKELKRLTK